MGDAKSVGRFGKALGWFVTASLVSPVLGLVMANLLQPGKNPACRSRTSALGQPRHRQVHAQGLRQPPVPKSFAEAMANNEILQIVVFSMFFGVALASLGEKAKT
jgi:Na+/H+-dicarboxylate symporter